MTPETAFATRAVHAGEPRPPLAGSVVFPLFPSSTYIKSQPEEPLRYHRLNNSPQHHVLHAKLASLEGTEAALTLASGMAAIATALLALTQAGDHVLAQRSLYGGTELFLRGAFRDMGRVVTFIDPTPDALRAALRPGTRAVYVESLSNPLLRGFDYAALLREAKAHGLLTVIDNTFLSPFNFRPAALGFDVVLHSATKYLNGHSDLIAGVVAGSAAHVEAVARLANVTGACLDAHSLFLLNRGLKTLGLRMRQHNATAQTLAERLQGHPAVARVMYPGLASHPEHGLLKPLMEGFGGVLAFEYAGSAVRLAEGLRRLRIFHAAPSLGGVESLICRPVETSHAHTAPAERAAMGVTDNTVRVAVGVEDAEDLLADLWQALI